MVLSILTFFLSLFVGFTEQVVTATAHDYHISKCQIEYSEPDSALQITLHIYIDDLEEALRKQGKDKLFIATEKEDEQAEVHLFEYLKEGLALDVNKEKASYTFIGKEPSEDLQAIWCYLEIPNLKTVSDLSVNNTLLMEVFDDQKNIVSVMGPNKKHGYFLFQQGSSPEQMQF